ncbi:MAG: peptidoglycan bridge formation glycyltransferase FemA/FemB family protein [Anaerolineae bacterium]|nr:peptidoglycan bridge formation glycyltransferase FemA/FemB family protein [Anaerolineae bacterium]NUQ03969.1 peptidoglycan bridge formation glycyltransferase FemA/FemB family protein [Anaerolineae bacterium]
MSVEITLIEERDRWNNELRALPAAHILQSWEWGEFKRATTGWKPIRIAYRRAGRTVAMASIGVRRIGPLNVVYVPKGPALDYGDPLLAAEVLDHLQRIARHYRAIWLKIDPDVVAATGLPTGEVDDRTGEAVGETRDPVGMRFMGDLRDRGWRFSTDQVQFRNTIVIDLARDLETILSAMNQGTRRKMRIAERDGVIIRAGTLDDLPLLYDLYKVTGERDDFLIRPRAYYELAWQRFMEAGLAHPLIAELGGKPIAHVILFHFGRKCWYFYGASSNEARDSMPNYLLQWEAIRWAKAQGYAQYDMWGAPDVFDESDRLWGVFSFKRGFRGVVTRHIGAWDYVPYPPLYMGYEELMPRVRAWLRRKQV